MSLRVTPDMLARLNAAALPPPPDDNAEFRENARKMLEQLQKMEAEK